MDLSGLSNMYTADTSVLNVAGKAYFVAQILCYTAAVIILMVKGYKLMKASPEAKAEVKKELVSYAIGAIILFAIGTFIGIIANISQETFQ